VNHGSKHAGSPADHVCLNASVRMGIRGRRRICVGARVGWLERSDIHQFRVSLRSTHLRIRAVAQRPQITDLPDVSSNISLNTKIYSQSPQNVGNGMRWTRRCRQTCETSADEQSRVVKIPRRWNQVCQRWWATEAIKPGTPAALRESAD
jgi:hypothetical protein